MQVPSAFSFRHLQLFRQDQTSLFHCLFWLASSVCVWCRVLNLRRRSSKSTLKRAVSSTRWPRVPFPFLCSLYLSGWCWSFCLLFSCVRHCAAWFCLPWLKLLVNSTVLVGLYEAPDRPQNAIEYVVLFFFSSDVPLPLPYSSIRSTIVSSLFNRVAKMGGALQFVMHHYATLISQVASFLFPLHFSPSLSKRAFCLL